VFFDLHFEIKNFIKSENTWFSLLEVGLWGFFVFSGTKTAFRCPNCVSDRSCHVRTRCEWVLREEFFLEMKKSTSSFFPLFLHLPLLPSEMTFWQNNLKVKKCIPTYLDDVFQLYTDVSTEYQKRNSKKLFFSPPHHLIQNPPYVRLLYSCHTAKINVILVMSKNWKTNFVLRNRALFVDRTPMTSCVKPILAPKHALCISDDDRKKCSYTQNATVCEMGS